jgi:D-alanine-D-alanine ligase
MKTSQAQHVAVLMGGISSERDVSLRSGRACAEALRIAGYRVTPVDATLRVGEVLAALKPDVVFNALHGSFGEDGKVQGILEALGLPYTHSGVLASALAMDKAQARIVMDRAGVPVANGLVADVRDVARLHVMKPPYVVKPIAEGSSVGVIIVKEGDEPPAKQLSLDTQVFSSQVLVEEYIAGRELTAAVMGDKSLGVTEIIANTVFYDYEAKYAKGGSTHLCPAPLKRDIYHMVEELALRAHRALGCRGVSRADFRYDDGPEGSGALVCLEVNTQPGMTETSLVPELAHNAAISFSELVRWMVEDASTNR